MTQPVNPDSVTLDFGFGGPILDMAGREILDIAEREIHDLGWSDRLADARASSPIVLREGIMGSGPLARVGDPGELTFTLDDSNQNSAAIEGLYMPDSANVEARFQRGAPVRLAVVSGARANYKRGRIKEIKPDTHPYGPKSVDLIAGDWMEDAATTALRRIPVQLSRRDDQLIQTIIDSIANPPASTDLATGPDTYDYALHDLADEEDTVITAFQRISDSGLGYIFVRGDDDPHGETLVYQSRHTRLEALTSVATLSDSMRDLQIRRSAGMLVRKCIAVAYPVDVDAAATTVLFSLTKELTFAAGETKRFVARFRDPNGNATRVSAVGLNTPLTADTDYKLSSVSGSGNDLNASLSITIDDGANSVEFILKNNAVSTAYLWHFQIRGKGVYIYDPLEYEVEADWFAAEDSSEGQDLIIDMKYSDDLNRAVDIAGAMIEWWSIERTEVESVSFIANRTQALMDAYLDGVCGSVITLGATRANLSDDFFINGREVEVWYGGLLINVTWFLALARTASFWKLGVVGFSELDVSTLLGW